MSDNWIAGAIKKPGALTAQAKAVGKTVSEFCSQGKLSSKAKKRCSLRKTLMGFKK